MAAIATSSIAVPVEVANEIFAKTAQTSTLARLSNREPQKFGTSNVMVLSGDVLAELVGEGAQKSPTNPTFATKTVTPHKLQTTVRISNEVKWADEDYQLDVWNTVAERCSIALGRALDLVGYHKLNPLTGAVAQSVTTGIADTTNAVTISSGNYTESVEAAAGLVIADGYVPSGIALDPALSFGLATQRNADGIKFNPDMGLGIDVASYAGMGAAVSTAVSASAEAATATKVIGFVGQFDAFRWGVQREIGAEVIEYGDPDGLGDLKRQNQIALRMEIVYGIGILDLNAFAKIVTA